MIKLNIKTKGMHCSSCEMLIKDSLEDLKGVIKANASHKLGIVNVEFDKKKINEFKIKQAIISAGYKVL